MEFKMKGNNNKFNEKADSYATYIGKHSYPHHFFLKLS